MARIVIVAIVIAGFFVTGDIASVLQGGRQAVNTVAGWPQQITNWLSSGNGVAEAAPAAIPAPALPQVAVPATPRPQPPRIPSAATTSARLSDLSPGDRLLVWCGSDGPSGTIELLAIDLIDPARSEALLCRHLDPRTDLAQLRLRAGPIPSRVAIETAVIQRAETVSFRPVLAGLAVRRTGARRAAAQPLHTGPVLAVLIVRRD